MNCGPYCKCDDCREACSYSGLGYSDDPFYRLFWEEEPPKPEPTCTCESQDLFNQGRKRGYLDKLKDKK